MNAVDNNSTLLDRVKRMIEKREKTFHYKHQLLALLFITFTLSFIGWFTPSKRDVMLSGNPPAQPASPVIISKIDNPLFNPVFFFTDARKEKETETKKVVVNTTKIIRRTPHLAIPDKSEFLQLDKIASPLTLNASFEQNRIEVVPLMLTKVDSLSSQHTIDTTLYN